MADVFVAVLVIHLHFPESGSLKGKRRELSSLKAQLHGRHGASVAEVAHQDTWQRSTVVAALCSGSVAHVRDHADHVERWLDERFPEGVRVERTIASLTDMGG